MRHARPQIRGWIVALALVAASVCVALPAAAHAQTSPPDAVPWAAGSHPQVISAPPTIAPRASAPAASAPAASAPASPGSERRDLLLDLPATLGGMETQAQVTRGEEHFANLEPGDADARQTAEELTALLVETGASIDDLSSGYALVSLDDLFAFSLAVRVEGAEPGTLLPAYLPILLGDLIEPSTSEARVGGKDVLVITSQGDAGDDVDLYVYDAGDTIWMIQGPDDIVRATLEDLP